MTVVVMENIRLPIRYGCTVVGLHEIMM